MKRYSHLQPSELCKISALAALNLSSAAIAAELKRHPATIRRERARSPGRYDEQTALDHRSAHAAAAPTMRNAGTPPTGNAWNTAYSAITPRSKLGAALTPDQGSEFAQLERCLPNAHIFACDPHSPRQKGIVENHNGLIRCYIPKGYPISEFSPDYVQYADGIINDRSRKSISNSIGR